MTAEQLLFLAVGAVTLIAAILVVTSPRLVHAGLWLILALAGVAVLFVLLENGFLAVVQVAIYIDAIAILIENGGTFVNGGANGFSSGAAGIGGLSAGNAGSNGISAGKFTRVPLSPIVIDQKPTTTHVRLYCRVGLIGQLR